MDEFENNSLPLLLLLDENLFPQFLEWSAAQGWSHLVLFLLESDSLRFRQEAGFGTSSKANFNLQSTMLRQLTNNFEVNDEDDNLCSPSSSSSSSSSSHKQLLCKSQVQALKRITDARIPLHAVFSAICDIVWDELVIAASYITKYPIWTSIRKSIISRESVSDDTGGAMGLSAILTADPLYQFGESPSADADMEHRKLSSLSHYRNYFDRFLRNDPPGLVSLQCWLRVRQLLTAIEPLLPASQRSDSSDPADTAHDGSSKSRFLQRLKRSSQAIQAATNLSFSSYQVSAIMCLMNVPFALLSRLPFTTTRAQSNLQLQPSPYEVLNHMSITSHPGKPTDILILPLYFHSYYH